MIIPPGWLRHSSKLELQKERAEKRKEKATKKHKATCAKNKTKRKKK